MDKNRKSLNKSPSILQKKKSVSLLNCVSAKSRKYLLSKIHNPLEETKDTFLNSKIYKSKKHKQGLKKESSCAQITSKTLIYNPKLLGIRLMTQCQNRNQNHYKSHSQKKNSLVKAKDDEEKKINARLSLDEKKREVDCHGYFRKYQQTEHISQVNLQQFTKQRQNIKKQLKKVYKKTKLEKKDILKISSQYEQLLDRFVFTQIPLNSPYVNNRLNEAAISNVSCFRASNQGQNQNFLQQTECKKKKVKNLQLNSLKKLGIKDYNDEFMSHYQELSHSWKRDIDIQKRF